MTWPEVAALRRDRKGPARNRRPPPRRGPPRPPRRPPIEPTRARPARPRPPPPPSFQQPNHPTRSPSFLGTSRSRLHRRTNRRRRPPRPSPPAAPTNDAFMPEPRVISQRPTRPQRQTPSFSTINACTINGADHPRHAAQTPWPPNALATKRLGHQTPWPPNAFATKRLRHQTPSPPNAFATKRLRHQTARTASGTNGVRHERRTA
jgi:hypothetical protein